MGGSWGPDNTIVFASRGAGLNKVSAAGGVPQPLAGTNSGTWPEILPDNRTVLFTTGFVIAAIPLSGGQVRILARTNDSSFRGPRHTWGRIHSPGPIYIAGLPGVWPVSRHGARRAV